jgi:polysaccharide pyruvyl transferase WcaK-like protein
MVGALLPVKTSFDGSSRNAKVSVLRWLLTLSWATRELFVGRPPKAVLRYVENFDLVVLNGGSNIYAERGAWMLASLGRLVTILIAALAAKKSGKPFLGVGHTIGPFDYRIPRRLARYVLGSVETLQVRDDASVQIAKALGIDAIRGPDVAFGLEPSMSPRTLARIHDLPVPMSDSLVVCVRQHYTLGPRADAALVEAIAEACRELLRTTELRQIVVVPHTVGPTAIEDDRPMSRDLVLALRGSEVVEVDDDFSPNELVAFYGAARVVLSVRLHGAILSVAGGTPAFAIEYFGTKTPGAMTSAGLPDSWVRYADASSDRLVEGIVKLLDVDSLSSFHRSRLGLAKEIEQATEAWPELQ